MLLRFLPALFLLLAVAGAAVAEEAITDFRARIAVRPSGEVAVSETIRVQAEARRIRRGIFRDFPTQYRLPSGERVTTTFDVESVTMNGGEVEWRTERIANGVRVRIGDPDVFLDPGQYSYTIRYTSNRQLYHGEGFDELYWNVTGQGWEFPIYRAEAAVSLPEGAVIRSYEAWTGRQGGTGKSFEAEQLSTTAIRFTTTRTLRPREGLTVSVTWPAGLVARPTATERAGHFLADNLALIIGYAGFLVIAGYFYAVWCRVGKDPDPGPIVAAYEPPGGVSPAAAGYVRKRDYSDRAFTAAIVSLAVKGALTIRERGKKKFTLIKAGAGRKLSQGEQAIARQLFLSGGEIETGTKQHKTFRAAMKAHEQVLEKAHEGIHFIRNQKHFWIGAAISLAAAALAVLAAAGNGAWEVLMFPLFLVLYGGILFVLHKRSRVFSLSGSGLRKIRALVVVGILGVHFFGLAGAMLVDHFMLLVPFALILGANIVFYNLLEKPTVEGSKLLAEIEGFRKYLSVAEKERLDFHTGPVTPEKFEEYLPYAIALGVETEWGKAFEAEMAKAGLDPAEYQPRWYAGGRFYGGGFRGANFARGFSGAFAGAVAAASTPPSRGGSGGGGFAGGGGGGGGGGGW